MLKIILDESINLRERVHVMSIYAKFGKAKANPRKRTLVPRKNRAPTMDEMILQLEKESKNG